MNKTTNKDLTDFGRREAGVCITNNSFGWDLVVSAKLKVENNAILYGNPTRGEVKKAYADFIEKLNTLGG